jgi:hypothetical protein
MIFELLKLNPGKVAILIILGISTYGLKLPNDVIEKEILLTLESGGIFYNISAEDKVYKSKEPIDAWVYEEPSDLWVISLMCVILCTILIIAATAIADDDIGWGWEEARNNHYYKKIKMYKDGDDYNYYLNGKLLRRTQTPDTRISLKQYLLNKNLLEDYTPTQVKRNNFLSNILK